MHNAPQGRSSAPAATGRLVHLPKSMTRRIAFVGCYLAFLALLLFVGYRVYWDKRVKAVWDQFYPELRTSGVSTANIARGDDTIDVVMLGASTLEPSWGDIEQHLLAGLKREFGDRVRIFNLAKVAHTSRDSALKYSRIANKPFDLVLIYDGFNDCRMNNCSPGIFRDDYSHCIWYRGFERRRKAGAVVLPLDIVNDLTETIGLGTPDVNALQYGNKLKTPGPFRHNLEEIVTAAAKQHAAVVLQTFAYHIPENYTEEKFAKEELDYGDRGGLKRCELKMWGLADNVLACVQAHNEVIRNLSEKYPDDAVFIDQQRLMAGKGELFIDPCHFSKSGTRQFVDNLLPLVVKRLREKQSDSRK